VAATITDHGEKRTSNGLETDAEGNLYAASYEAGAVLRRTPDGTRETLAHDPAAVDRRDLPTRSCARALPPRR